MPQIHDGAAIERYLQKMLPSFSDVTGKCDPFYSPFVDLSPDNTGLRKECLVTNKGCGRHQHHSSRLRKNYSA